MRLLAFIIIWSISFSVLAQKPEQVQYLAEYAVKTQAGTKKVKMTCLIPQQINNVQHIDTIIYSHVPNRIYEEDNDRLVEFIIDSIQGDFTIQILAKLHLFPNDVSAKHQITNDQKLSSYVLSEKYIEADNIQIKQKAESLTKKTTESTVQNIYNFVHKSMRYSGYNPKSLGASIALEQRHGDCTEFADLFVALCRANSIPARVIEGYKTKNITMPQHNWAEVYLPNKGWRIVDPTIPSFGKLDNSYIKLTSNRNNKNLNGFHFYTYNSWGSSIKVEDSIKTF